MKLPYFDNTMKRYSFILYVYCVSKDVFLNIHDLFSSQVFVSLLPKTIKIWKLIFTSNLTCIAYYALAAASVREDIYLYVISYYQEIHQK